MSHPETFTPRRSLFRRSALAALGSTVAMSLVLSGCGDSSDSEDSSAGADNLVVGITADPLTLFPWKATQFQAVNVLQNLYGTLTEFDADMTVVAGLAESWKISDDGLKVTLKLRSGVTFSDGSTFGPEDVKYSLEQIKDPENAAVAADTLANVESIETSGTDGVVLNLSAPDASLLANLASVNVAMISSKDSEATLTSQPNGTGPFTFDSRTANQSIKLVKNAKYWGTVPGLDKLEFRIIPDESSILSAMQSGNVQLAVFDDPMVAKNAKGGSITIERTPQLNYHVLQLNARRGALTDKNVRLAVQCAIDRKQVLDTAALGEGEITGPITSPAYRSDPSDRPCPDGDTAKAKDLLAQAGKKKVEIKTIVSQGQYSTSVNEAQNLKSQLAKAGITLKLEILESGAYVKRWSAGDFDAAVALNGARPDPDGMYARYFTSDGKLNPVAGYSSDRLDQLFQEGKAANDLEERQGIYRQVSSELEDNAAWIWLFTGYSYTAKTATVHGFTPMANGSLQFLRATTVS